jgi:hypothetical protein
LLSIAGAPAAAGGQRGATLAGGAADGKLVHCMAAAGGQRCNTLAGADAGGVH